MAGQVNVTIGSHMWVAYLANEAWELTQGLSNLASMDAGSGMFFDTGYQHLISVQTLQMLFNLDIAFINEDFKVVEIHRNVPNSQEFTATELARYFLEVNAGEMADIDVGDDVVVELVTGPVVGVVPSQGGTDMWSMMGMMIPMILVGGLGVGMIASTTGNNPGNNNSGKEKEYIVTFYDGRVRRMPGPLKELQKLPVKSIEEAD